MRVETVHRAGPCMSWSLFAGEALDMAVKLMNQAIPVLPSTVRVPGSRKESVTGWLNSPGESSMGTGSCPLTVASCTRPSGGRSSCMWRKSAAPSLCCHWAWVAQPPVSTRTHGLCVCCVCQHPHNFAGSAGGSYEVQERLALHAYPKGRSRENRRWQGCSRVHQHLSLSGMSEWCSIGYPGSNKLTTCRTGCREKLQVLNLAFIDIPASLYLCSISIFSLLHRLTCCSSAICTSPNTYGSLHPLH